MSLTSTSKVSIRLKSGGHSFSEREREMLRGATAGVEVCVITAKTTLIPQEHYDSNLKSYYLTSMGLTPSATEIVVESHPQGGMIAVMAIEREIIESLKDITSDVSFTSPLLDEAIEQGTIIELSDNVGFIRVYRDGLRFAEAVAIDSDADLSYIVERLNDSYGIYNMYARAKGDVERVCRICKGCFKNLTK